MENKENGKRYGDFDDKDFNQLKRGKRPKVDSAVQEGVYEANIDRFIVDGKLVKSGSNIYYTIADELGMGKQAVYLAVKRFIERKKIAILESSDDEDEEEYLPIEYFNRKIDKSTADLAFDINIGEMVLFEDNSGKLLDQKDWTETINGILWEFARLPCEWRFDRLRKVCDEFIISGSCSSTDCSKVFAYTERNCLLLKIIIKNFKETALHLRKRMIQGSGKQEIDNLLQSNKPCVVYSKLANSLMTDHDSFEPAHLPKVGTLRVHQHRKNKTEYLHENPILAIRRMKESGKYFGCIDDIGLDPFYCFYSTPLQRELLRVHTRYRKCRLSFDATGLPEIPAEFSSVREDSKQFKRTFLYSLTLQADAFNIPVYQLLSQRQRSDFIQYALACFKYVCFSQKNPNEVIMDDSSALLLSTIQCFTSCKTMQSYLNACYDALFADRPPPECYIRLDRAHIVKAILSMECFKHDDKRRKWLFQRIFGYLITIEDPKAFQEVVKCVFILINNKFENDEFVSSSKKFLKSLSDLHSFEMNDNDIISKISEEPDPDQIDLFGGNSKIRIWINEIHDDVLLNFMNADLNESIRQDDSIEDDLIDNIHYAPHLNKPFIDFLVKVPLFSNIMNKAFGCTNLVAASASTESGFGVLKNQILQSGCRVRLDKIVEKHIDYIQGYLKPYATKKYTPMMDDADINKEEIEPEERISEVYEENWRNKNFDARKTKPRVANNHCKNSILDPVKPHSRYVPILKNGYRVMGTKNKNGMILTQTCPFDSLYQIFAVCCADMQIFAKKIEETESQFSDILRNLLNPDYDVYEGRSKLLLLLFPEKPITLACNITVMDCEMSIFSMFQAISSECEAIQSFKEFKKCTSSKCTFTSGKVGKSFVPTRLNNLDLKNLESSFFFTERISYCQICNSELATCREFNSVLSFDVEVASKEGVISAINIDDISKYITVEQQRYNIRGVVEYCCKLKHFKSHIWRSNNTWETHDDIYPAKPTKTPKQVVPVFLVYSLVEGSHEVIVEGDIKIAGLIEDSHEVEGNVVEQCSRKEDENQCSGAIKVPDIKEKILKTCSTDERERQIPGPIKVPDIKEKIIKTCSTDEPERQIPGPIKGNPKKKEVKRNQIKPNIFVICEFKSRTKAIYYAGKCLSILDSMEELYEIKLLRHRTGKNKKITFIYPDVEDILAVSLTNIIYILKKVSFDRRGGVVFSDAEIKTYF